MFKAIVLDKVEDQQTVAFKELDEAQLPEGDVTVRVAYSTMNYKDALALTGSAPIAKSYRWYRVSTLPGWSNPPIIRTISRAIR